MTKAQYPPSFYNRLFRQIADERHPDYNQRAIPCELDDEVSNFVNLFIQASPNERKSILSLTSEANSFVLIVFAERMAALGVREKSSKRLLEGLLALIIESFKFDYRDNMTVWALLYHSAMKIGIDPDSLFRNATSYAKNTVSEWMVDFLGRTPEEKSLETFRFKEAQGTDGFRYERLT